MGRHHLRLPDHLYLSPPTPPPPAPYSLASASSFLLVRSAASYASPTILFQDSGRYPALSVSDRIPGLRVSAAFLSTLRANLVLESDSAPSSVANTPDCLRPVAMPSSGTLLPPPSPSPLAQNPTYYHVTQDTPTSDSTPSSNPLDSIPGLTTQPAITEDDKVEGLHLLADSVAQQRQLASTAILFHPTTLAILILTFALCYHYLYHGSRSDFAIIGTTTSGIFMAVLITARWLSSGYIEQAERVGTWKWLNRGRDIPNNGIVGEEDEILLTRFGDQVIGTIVIRGIRERSTTTTSPGNSSPKKSRAKIPVTTLIRGWTVSRKYRHKGVGTGLLEQAVEYAQQNGWQGPEFASDHAHSARILPETFNGGFVKREAMARELLDGVKQEKSQGMKNGRRVKR
ncbi:hypothetical protein PV10_04655 [Exophiala mesophila]|uniref:N-acetyltransferase domain-containing protein n=1 Tax=Exophiala mesophila TaxID=212818 RepID=A0A0D1ZFC7_EXOME|nr:uncharacterized protein PV10_04655 [Exophiala mesophila]KIV93442.1 hypothetical protein PV10_04655 [Exophiala mesophila]